MAADESKKEAGDGDSKEKPKGSGPTASRQQKRREERLKLIDEQVADGSLTIRQMTPAERKANPPKNLRKKRRH
ncbi:MAG: hypothetical protein ACR2G3_05850 [Solirubrobacterales bacterium]